MHHVSFLKRESFSEAKVMLSGGVMQRQMQFHTVCFNAHLLYLNVQLGDYNTSILGLGFLAFASDRQDILGNIVPWD